MRSQIKGEAPRWAGKLSPEMPFEVLAHHAAEHHHLLDHSIYLHKAMPIGATAHQAGTIRFGNDPATSALDATCKAHELDNLYVVDTSFFPSIGAVNPSLTAIANAMRVGDHLLERLGVAVPAPRARDLGAAARP